MYHIKVQLSDSKKEASKADDDVTAIEFQAGNPSVEVTQGIYSETLYKRPKTLLPGTIHLFRVGESSAPENSPADTSDTSLVASSDVSSTNNSSKHEPTVVSRVSGTLSSEASVSGPSLPVSFWVLLLLL